MENQKCTALERTFLQGGTVAVESFRGNEHFQAACLSLMGGDDVLILCFQRLARGVLETDEEVLFLMGHAREPDCQPQTYAIFECIILPT